MKLLDSSVWIEYLTEGPRVSASTTLFNDPESILVSVINIFEICRYVRRTAGADVEESVLAHLLTCAVRPLGVETTRVAVDLAAQYKLHMADSLIAATAQVESADLWTLDRDLMALPFAQRP
ncbi:MAG: type II toxin-antitoxin system VapC family toxin [Deltaproteobacteria bacterium]|nr:type II toxin-antitoxin system VapC family toxin [Deltaproteobacteria bacterium]